MLTICVEDKDTSGPWSQVCWFRPLKMAAEVPKTCKVVMAETIAKKMIAEVHETLATIQGAGDAKPCLVAFLANDDPAAVKYAEWSKKTCEEK